MKHILITGGAGFIGVNTAYHYLAKGDAVTIFDNLSRRGTAYNLKALKKHHPNVRFIKGDIRDIQSVEKIVRGVDIIFHFAGQVAVTTSVVNPREDFEINAIGTLNVLEAVRTQKLDPIIIYASTNKVYGDLSHLKIKETPMRYEFINRPHGISEIEPLDFHSPYGCSKGSADQYMHDYHRIYNLKTIVFRQSCIYGPHQFGVEDQGWMAWFMAAALLGRPITIYGNGKQVRDVLYIDDLLALYDGAIEKKGKAIGQVYNVGGGFENTISVWKEFGPVIAKLTGKTMKVVYKKERPGDQPIFIADTTKAWRELKWIPSIHPQDGIAKLYTWLVSQKKALQSVFG